MLPLSAPLFLLPSPVLLPGVGCLFPNTEKCLVYASSCLCQTLSPAGAGPALCLPQTPEALLSHSVALVVGIVLELGSSAHTSPLPRGWLASQILAHLPESRLADS